MSAPYNGGCQCGAVRYAIDAEPAGYYACHCTDCQRQSGSAFGLSLRVKATAVRITNGAPKTFESKGESGRIRYGIFCPDCGTRLYNSLGSLTPWFNIKPGTLDAPLPFAPVAHIWTRSKQPWTIIPDEAASFDGQPSAMDALEKLWAEYRR